MRSPGTTPTNSATTQTPLSGMTTSTSSPTLRTGSPSDGQKRPNIIAADGQKTIAQLQSERAAQLMQYYQPPPPGGNGQNPAMRQQGTNVTGKMSPSGLQDRPRGSPPTVSPQQGSGSPRSNTLQHQQAAASKAGHLQQGSRTVSRSPQSAGQNVAITSGARTKTTAQLVVGSPPEHVSPSHIATRVRGQSVSSSAEGPQDGHSNGQTTVVSSSSTAVLRNSPSNAPSPGQQVFKQANSHTASAKAKRFSAHIPLTALHAVDIRLSQKPRRYSDSDHNPDRPRFVRQSSQSGQSKHAADTTPKPVSPPTVPVRDSASLLPSAQLAPAGNVKVEKVGLCSSGCCM